MGKAFEKQIKTTEVQGQKQVDVLKDLKLKEQARITEDKFNDKASIQEEIFVRLLDERMDDIQKIGKKSILTI